MVIYFDSTAPACRRKIPRSQVEVRTNAGAHTDAPQQLVFLTPKQEEIQCVDRL